ncbi:MAG: hypothetical protein ACYDD7_15580 [Acidimicrobiales bacterium]
MTRGDGILVIGAGAIGLCLAFLLMHGETRTAFSVTDLNLARLDRMRRVIRPVGEAVANPAGKYDVVFDVSGAVSGLRLACQTVAPGGRICTMSHLPGGTTYEFLFEELMHKDVTFTISYLNGEPANLADAIRLIESHWGDQWDTMLNVVPLDRLPTVISERASSPWNKTIVDLGYSPGRTT